MVYDDICFVVVFRREGVVGSPREVDLCDGFSGVV